MATGVVMGIGHLGNLVLLPCKMAWPVLTLPVRDLGDKHNEHCGFRAISLLLQGPVS